MYAKLNNGQIVKLHRRVYNNKFYDYMYFLRIYEYYTIFPSHEEVLVNLKLNIYYKNIEFNYRIKNIVKITSKLRK